MSAETVVLRGFVRADGTLDVPGKVTMTPGPVEITVRVVGGAKGEGLVTLLARIAAEQQASGHLARTREEIDADIGQMRDEWEEHQLAIERLQEECRRQRDAGSAGKEPSL
jgi:hypothetical protein